jgi:hypothetical protein
MVPASAAISPGTPGGEVAPVVTAPTLSGVGDVGVLESDVLGPPAEVDRRRDDLDRGHQVGDRHQARFVGAAGRRQERRDELPAGGAGGVEVDPEPIGQRVENGIERHGSLHWSGRLACRGRFVEVGDRGAISLQGQSAPGDFDVRKWRANATAGR